MPMVRHFLLKVNAPEAARKLIGRLVSGDEADAPQIRTAKDWHVGVEPGPGDDTASAPCCKPCDCVNVSIPWLGLLALEVKDRIPSPLVPVVQGIHCRCRRARGICRRHRS